MSVRVKLLVKSLCMEVLQKRGIGNAVCCAWQQRVLRLGFACVECAEVNGTSSGGEYKPLPGEGADGTGNHFSGR